MKNKMNILIDPEFKALIPPLSAEEKQQLETNLVEDGCRDPLVLWGDILVDGHNRHEICTRLDLPFKFAFKEFSSRNDAIEWIINNQFGRRNLNDYQRGVLALRMKPIIEARAKGQQATSTGGLNPQLSPKSDEGVQPIRTDTAVASLANLGKDTIRKIEHIEKEAAPEVKEWAAAGDVSINLAAQFAALPVQVQQQAIAAISEQEEPAKEVMREAVRAHVANNSGNNEWYTPARHIEIARQVMGGIDCDPATSEIANQTVKAETFFTAADDGLAQTWRGRVWMNPPYAQPLINDFAEAVSAKFESGEIDQACILVNNATETQWFQRMLSVANAVCFPKSRIKFIDPSGKPSGAPLQGQAIIYMGDNVRAFRAAFKPEGAVLFI
jgi:ParB family chromosome partitioning protein